MCCSSHNSLPGHFGLIEDSEVRVSDSGIRRGAHGQAGHDRSRRPAPCLLVCPSVRLLFPMAPAPGDDIASLQDVLKNTDGPIVSSSE